MKQGGQSCHGAFLFACDGAIFGVGVRVAAVAGAGVVPCTSFRSALNFANSGSLELNGVIFQPISLAISACTALTNLVVRAGVQTVLGPTPSFFDTRSPMSCPYKLLIMSA